MIKHLYKFLLFYFISFALLSIEISQIPLEKYVAQSNTSDAKVDKAFYSFTRCSGLFMYVASMTINPTSAKEKEVYNNSMAGAQVFNLQATNMWMLKTKKDNFEKANNHTFSVITRIIPLYEEDGKKYFASTGGHLSGYIKSDMTICSMLAKKLLKK